MYLDPEAVGPVRFLLGCLDLSEKLLAGVSTICRCLLLSAGVVLVCLTGQMLFPAPHLLQLSCDYQGPDPEVAGCLLPRLSECAGIWSPLCEATGCVVMVQQSVSTRCRAVVKRATPRLSVLEPPSTLTDVVFLPNHLHIVWFLFSRGAGPSTTTHPCGTVQRREVLNQTHRR